jgi:hypothetical protein
MNSSPALGSTSASGPSLIIGRSESYVFSVLSSENAVTWIFGVGQAMPLGSPGS